MHGSKRVAAAFILLACAGLGRAQVQAPIQGSKVETPPPIFPKLTQAISRPHQPVPVPLDLEIEVLDPNVDPRGNLAILTRPAPIPTALGTSGRVIVDIPPAVLVHRYYYTGDRSFQFRMLPGGPCIVVANHPKTGERLYIPVQFPPGAPRVHYYADCIEYDYGCQTVTISFCGLLHCGPKVTYRQGTPITRQVENMAIYTRDTTRRLVERTSLPEYADKAAQGAKSAIHTSIDRTNDLAKRVIAPPIAILKMTPLANLFTESQQDQASTAHKNEAGRAREQALRQEDAFIKTVR
jgi:hypothetical protein